MKRLLLTSTALALALPLATASAAPVLSVTATDNGVPLVFVPSVNTPGTLVGTFTDSAFASIGVVIDGVPDVPSPDLGTVNLSVTGSGAGTHVLDIVATQSGLTEPAGFKGQVTQTFNNLIGGAGPATENLIVNGSTVETHTFATTPPRSDSFNALVGPFGAITSDAEEFIATFTAPAQDLELTQEFQAVPSAVQEPGTLAILASALLVGGIGLRRRFRK